MIIPLVLAGCARSLIKLSVKADDNPYMMFGRIPSRDFYVPVDFSDSLVLKWQSYVYGTFPNSSVSVYDQYVFVNDLAGRIFCFNIDDGKKAGVLKYDGSVYTTPVPFKSTVVFAAAQEKENVSELIYYNYETGKEIDLIDIEGRVLTEMLVDDKDILFTTENGSAFRFSNEGDKIWETNTKAPTRSSPCLDGKLFIFGNDEGEIIALNKDTGDSVYVSKIGGHFFSGLTENNKTIYAGNENGILYAINSADGDLAWQFDTGARIAMNPAVDNENVYIGNIAGNLFSINKNTGKENWQKEFAGILNSTPLVSNNIIVLPDVKFAFHLIDKFNGDVIKTINLDGRAKLSPVYFRNKLLIGFDDGNLNAYEFVY